MQLRIKKTGTVIRVSERQWNSLRDKGLGHRYEVLSPVEQPQIKQVPQETRQAYSEFPEAEETPEPKKKKRRRKKQDVELNDLTADNPSKDKGDIKPEDK